MLKTRIQESPLQGRRVAITGRFSSMKREEALAFLDFVGAHHDRVPDEGTDFLVVGEACWLLGDEGHPTASLARAQSLRAKGAPVADDDIKRLVLVSRRGASLKPEENQNQSVRDFYKRMLDVGTQNILETQPESPKAKALEMVLAERLGLPAPTMVPVRRWMRVQSAG